MIDLRQGDCLELMKDIPDKSIDSIVTDPPYELGFMGKSWDNTGIANNVELWKECLRVLKPGGHLLAFSGTRTYHRMASAIEDAGFEVRDMIEWVYGSGFPKSLNIGKAVDKLGGQSLSWFIDYILKVADEKGISRKELTMLFPSKNGNSTGWLWNKQKTQGITLEQYHKIRDFLQLPFADINECEREIIGRGQAGLTAGTIANFSGEKEFDLTKGTSDWEGWGTALKPSHESICLAQKRLDTYSDIDYTKSICQTLFAQIVKKSSELNLSEKTQQGIVQWSAENNINTLEDLLEAMDILLSESEIGLNLNIVLSWLNILVEIWEVVNTSTTKMKISLTTELKILKSMEWENIFQSIMLVKNNKTDGLLADVYNVDTIFKGVQLKLKFTQELFAQESATDLVKDKVSRPSHEPICMARKPLAEKTVAENCLKWGTGGINIDESRVESNEDMSNIKAFGTMPENKSDNKGFSRPWMNDKQSILDKQNEAINKMKSMGRFPANLIHDGSDEVKECFPETSKGSISGYNFEKGNQDNPSRNTTNIKSGVHFGDSGNASRFFKSIIYQAKASKSERNKGLEHLEPTKTNDGRKKEIDNAFQRGSTLRNNHHPTVKPIKLMSYLITLTTREGDTVLDPFMGSGSTGVAAKNLNRNFIGIELDEKYFEIAKNRIENYNPNGDKR